MKIAVVLFNLGGPDNKDNIRPFLKNLFSDAAIIDLPQPFRSIIANIISTTRAPKVKPLYDIMGGRSPILPNTIAQKDALLAALKSKFPTHEFGVFISMRYWHPMSESAAKLVSEFAPDKVILLPLYPQYSVTTTGSSFKEFKRFYKGEVSEIKNFPQLGGLINSIVKNIMKEWDGLGNPQKIRVLFSAHGLPQKVIDAGDPYESEVNQTFAAVKSILPPFFDCKVCYQSKVGPLKWLEPATSDEIIRAGREKIGLIVVPVAFVSEHIETLVELDVEYKELAEHNGVPFYARAKTAMVDGDFINGLVELIGERIENVA